MRIPIRRIAAGRPHLMVRRYPNSEAQARMMLLLENRALAQPETNAPDFAIMRGLDAIVPVPLDAGAAVAARDRDGSIPPHDAALGGNAEIVLLLLERGADRNAVTAEGDTPLHAASWGKVEAVRALLDAGARTDVRNRGRAPLEAAVRNEQMEAAALLRR